MDNNTKRENEIANLMFAVDKILELNDDSISILRTHSVANFRAVKRNSASMRDPDPLNTTMNCINRAFPITCDKKKFMKLDPPTNLIMNSTDPRRQGRIPCKIEALHYYLEHSPNVEDKERRVIDGLMSIQKEALRIYNSIQWDNLQFVREHVSLNRIRMPTNPFAIEASRDVVIQAIMNVLCPLSTIAYQPVPAFVTEHIQNILKNDCLTVRSAASTYNHVLQSSLNRSRVLPMLEGVSPEFMVVSHALFTNTAVCKNLNAFVNKESRKNVIVSSVCMAIIYLMNNVVSTNVNIKALVDNIRIHDMGLIDHLKETHENKYVNAVKALIGMKASNRRREGITFFYSAASACKPVQRRYLEVSNRYYYVINGEEHVYFMNKYTQGMFRNKYGVLTSLTMRKCEYDQFVETLADIMVSIGHDLGCTRGTTPKSVRSNVKGKIRRQPHICLVIESNEWEEFKQNYGMEPSDQIVMIGSVKFDNSIQCIIPPPVNLRYEGKTLYDEKGMEIATFENIQKPDPLDYSVTGGGTIFMDFLDVRHAFPGMYLHTLMQMKKVIEECRSGKIESVFPTAIDYVKSHFKHLVQNECRYLVEQMLHLDNLDVIRLAFYHMLCGSSAHLKKSKRLRSSFGLIGVPDVVDLSLTDGAVFVDQQGARMNMFGKVVTCNNQNRSNKLTDWGLLPDFTIRPPHKGEIYPVKTIGWLRQNNVFIEHSTKYMIDLAGKLLVATKDMNLKRRVRDTVNKVLMVETNADPALMVAEQINEMKRKASDDENASRLKKLKTESIIDSGSS
uniref:Polymerase PB2 n=1 Tax=Hubei orthomyxo-like virus 2 TaxID=1923006 RepID=A0A1L3KKF2_9VIRU|nr:polymerase PB2 [Hubei orthomyxo-like virus 2]